MKFIQKCLWATILFFAMSAMASVAAPPQDDILDHGTIDWLSEDKIIINDTEFVVTVGTVYRDGYDKQTNGGYLKVGMRVEFEADADYQLAFIREHLDPDALEGGQVTAPPEEQDTDTAPASLDEPEGIYQEGGVWKN